ncbi:MAG: hypothetical protein Rubg2KO_10810 [Rubricoccaceae bacterium]
MLSVHCPIRRADYARLATLDRQLAREQPVDHTQNLKIVEGLVQEAIALGVWPPADKLAGIEVDIRRARILNQLDVRHASR